MKLATTTEDFEPFCGTYEEQIQHITEAGFKYIDLSLYNVGENHPLIESENYIENAKKLKEFADRTGVEFVQSHAPRNNPLASPGDFEKSIRQAIRSIEVCKILGIPNLVIHPGWADGLNKKEWFCENKKFFEKLFPATEKHNVNVLHENQPMSFPFYYSKTGKDMREFSEFLNHPKFHSCWDVGHGNIGSSQYSQYNDILNMGSDLYALHVNDNRGERDEHIIPFSGTVDMDEIMTALADIGYKGFFTFEACYSISLPGSQLYQRHDFKKSTRLKAPPLALKKELEKYLYNVGKYILEAYEKMEKD